MNPKTPPSSARICRDCSNLVTADLACPLCDRPTNPHPEANDKEAYCVLCAGGLFQAANMHLVTWNEDATLQDEDGDLSLICEDCHNDEEHENW